MKRSLTACISVSLPISHARLFHCQSAGAGADSSVAREGLRIKGRPIKESATCWSEIRQPGHAKAIRNQNHVLALPGGVVSLDPHSMHATPKSIKRCPLVNDNGPLIKDSVPQVHQDQPVDVSPQSLHLAAEHDPTTLTTDTLKPIKLIRCCHCRY